MESGRIRARLVIGLVLVSAGISSLLERAHVFDQIELGQWWPLLPITAGLFQLARHPEQRGGWVLLALGGWLLGITLTSLRFGETWPLLVMVWGASLIWQGLDTKPEYPSATQVDLKVATADLKVRTTEGRSADLQVC
jgi:hypothetical protein